MNAGDFRLGDTFDIKFTTIDSTGLGSALTSGVVAAYPGNSITEITAGITLTANFDSRTGLNNVRVVATSGNGYATATNYVLVLTAGTVDGISVVGYVIAHFSIENRSALMPTTAARTIDISAGGEAGIDWANIGSPTTAQNLSATNFDVDQVVASVSGAVGSVTGAVTVGTINANVVTASALAADAATEIADAVWASTTRVLTANTNLNDPTAAAIADAVWDEAQADHVIAGSFGEVATEVAAILTDTGTTLDGLITTVDTVVDAVKVQTDKLTFTVANQVDANVQYINDAAVTGDGSATPWGPV